MGNDYPCLNTNSSMPLPQANMSPLLRLTLLSHIFLLFPWVGQQIVSIGPVFPAGPVCVQKVQNQVQSQKFHWKVMLEIRGLACVSMFTFKYVGEKTQQIENLQLNLICVLLLCYWLLACLWRLQMISAHTERLNSIRPVQTGFVSTWQQKRLHLLARLIVIDSCQLVLS